MRWIVRVIIGLVVLALLALGSVLFLPADRIARLAGDRFEVATGRALTIGGDIRPSLWPVLGVSTGAVSIANAPWSDKGPLLRAEALEIGVDPLALIRGDIRITKITVQAPDLMLEIGKDGRTNWDMSAAPDPLIEQTAEAAAAAPEGPGSGLPIFTLDRAEVTNGRLTFIDHAAGTSRTVEKMDATLRLPDFDGMAELELKASVDDRALSLSSNVESLATFLTNGAVPVDLKASVGGSKVSFRGRAGLSPLAAGGTLSAALDDMEAVFALLSMPAPDIPPGLGRSIHLDGEVTMTDAGKLTLRGGTVRLDGNSFRANADIAVDGPRPTITAQIAAGALDMSALAGAGETGASNAATNERAAGNSGWSRSPIDLSALQSFDASIAFAAESLDIGVAILGPTDLLMTLTDGRAVTEIRGLSAYDGVISGSFVVNSRGGLSVRTKLAATGVALEPLLRQLADYDRLSARGDLSLNVLAVGDDMHSLMHSLGGDGAFRLGKGEFRGFDLAGMIRNLDPGYVGAGQKTIFDSVNATFRIAAGILQNDDLAFLSPLLSASGKGRVGIGAQDIDYRLLPVLMEREDGQGIRVPVIVSGPWAQPRFRLDLEALVKQEFGDEIEQLKKDVEDRVTEKISEEIGVEVESLDTLEDTLKEELEERATRGILDLLGGNR